MDWLHELADKNKDKNPVKIVFALSICFIMLMNLLNVQKNGIYSQNPFIEVSIPFSLVT